MTATSWDALTRDSRAVSPTWSHERLSWQIFICYANTYRALSTQLKPNVVLCVSFQTMSWLTEANKRRWVSIDVDPLLRHVEVMLRLARSPRSHRLFPARRGRQPWIAALPVAVPVARIQEEGRRWVFWWTESWRPATLTRVSYATRCLTQMLLATATVTWPCSPSSDSRRIGRTYCLQSRFEWLSTQFTFSINYTTVGVRIVLCCTAT